MSTIGSNQHMTVTAGLASGCCCGHGPPVPCRGNLCFSWVTSLLNLKDPVNYVSGLDSLFAQTAEEHRAKSVIYFQGIYRTLCSTCYLYLQPPFPPLAISLCPNIFTHWILVLLCITFSATIKKIIFSETRLGTYKQKPLLLFVGGSCWDPDHVTVSTWETHITVHGDSCCGDS